MSSDWSSSPPGRGPHEYETEAELWLSNKTGSFSSIRKLQASQQRKKISDKRDSVAQLSTLDNSPKRLREKTSWLGMSRSYATTGSGDGQWVRVRCTLAEMDDSCDGLQCRLTIIADKGTLQHSLNVKALKATDIRFADHSLFFRSDCLSIHAPTGAFMAHSPSLQSLVPAVPDHVGGPRKTHRRQQSTAPQLEPIYLSFDCRDVANCWNALLRSYAKPEIYGLHVDARGLYRMWRQVNLTVMHGRNLGSIGKFAPDDGLASGAPLADTEREEGSTEAFADSSVFCEIVVDGFTSGRTTYRKGEAETPPNWTWLENFIFSDLPPFGIFSIRVWRKKKPKSTLVGTVDINLGHFPRAQAKEGWFPVMSSVPSGNGIHVGDLKLKMRVDEEYILPSDAYSEITSVLDRHNCLDLLRGLDQKMQLGDISIHMLSLAVGRGTFFKDIIDLAEREVDKAPNANTLFRGNSIFTKTVEQAMSFFGRQFLEATVGPCIQELCLERVELETDPTRNPKGAKDVEQSVKLLPIWCNKFWSHIYNMRDHCPSELRRLFQSIRELVERRFGADYESSNLKWQCVSAFCFLRLIVPAILHPHLWGLHPGLPPPALQRSLTLIAKALQSLANLTTEHKEVHMRGVSPFLEQNRSAMIDYIVQISSLPDRSLPEISDKYDRLLIIHSLRDRTEQMREATPLASEAIPLLPHLLDIPKHLAVLSSAVIRHSRTTSQPVTSLSAPVAQDSLVEDFALKCFEIEAKTEQCVSHLGPPPSATAARRHSQSVHNRLSNNQSIHGFIDETVRLPPVATKIDNRLRNAIDLPPWKRKSTKRPSTAPAAASAPHTSVSHTSLPSSPLISFYRRPSHDGGFPVPASTSGSLTMYTDHLPILASIPSRPQSGSDTLRHSLSHELDLQQIQSIEEAVAKRRRGFLRTWLSRTTK